MNTTFKYKNYIFTDNNRFKTVHSPNFNLFFDKSTGYTERWGATRADEDDPVCSEIGPTIVDMELCKDIKDYEIDKFKNELKVSGKTCLGQCPMCYKSNGYTNTSHFMSLIRFKEILMKMANTHIKFNDKLVYFLDEVEYEGKIIKAIDKPNLNWETDICNCSPVLQLALGVTNLDTNPELLQICEFAMKIGIIPNVTCHGKDQVSDQFLTRLCELCGNIAVSRYNPDISYNFIERLHYCGAKQINMHVFVSEETYDDVLKAFEDSINDKRLKYLTSIVLLFLKQKGRGIKYTRLSDEKYKSLFQIALDNNIRLGFDICCSHRFTDFIRTYHNQDMNYPQVYDVCDSGRFSCYVNSLGEYCPCSFIEDDGIWKNGPSVLKCHNFIDEIWNGDKSDLYKTMLLSNNNSCIYYEI